MPTATYNLSSSKASRLFLPHHVYATFADKRDFAVPKLKMVTPVLNEEGSVLASEDCLLTIEITNLSKLMKLKLSMATAIIT